MIRAPIGHARSSFLTGYEGSGGQGLFDVVLHFAALGVALSPQMQLQKRAI